MFNYVVSAQPATAVRQAVKLPFTDPSSTDLVLARGSTLAVWRASDEGFSPFADVELYGTIATVTPLPLPNIKTTAVFVTTETLQFFALAFNTDTGQFDTIAKGDFADTVTPPGQYGQIVRVGPNGKFILLHAYNSVLKVITISDEGVFSDPADVRLEQLDVFDIQPLAGAGISFAQLSFANELPIVTTHTVTASFDLTNGPDIIPNDVPTDAYMLIPVLSEPTSVIVVGENTVCLCGNRGGSGCTIAMSLDSVETFTFLDDGSRCLLGDAAGTLAMLVLTKEGDKVAKLEIETLGKTSIASSLAYVDDGYVFVGSRAGDSQLVRLSTHPLEDGTFVQAMDSYDNVGPVVDFCVMEQDGTKQLVTCSGIYGDGSLRVIRSGISVHALASIDLEGLEGMWSLRPSSDASAMHTTLALSFPGQTSFLSIETEEFEARDVSGAVTDESTLSCATVAENQWVQVVASKVRLIDAKTYELLTQWQPPEGMKIGTCSVSASHVLVACKDNAFLLSVDRGSLMLQAQTRFEHEIACMDVVDSGSRSSFCVFGLWEDITLRVCKKEDLSQVFKIALGGDIIPRSLCIASFKNANYVLCGMGDGGLNFFEIDSEGQLSSGKRMQIGRRPTMLRAVAQDDDIHVIACSDRPTVAYVRDKRIMFSHINGPVVSHVCDINTEAFPKSLALFSEDSLTIGTMESVRKLQIQTVRLGESPLRISFQPTTKTLMVATQSDSPSSASLQGSLRLYDADTFDQIEALTLDAQESIASCTSCRIGDEDTDLYAVGTAYIDPNEDEPHKGRLLLVRCTDKKIQVVHEQVLEGAVYAVTPFRGKLLVAVGGKMLLMSVNKDMDGQFKLQSECGYFGSIAITMIKTRGDFVVLGDLMKSISLLVYKAESNSFEEVAWDDNPLWLVAMDVLDDDVFIGADDIGNLLTLRRNMEAATEEDRQRLELAGAMHTGHIINAFRRGSLNVSADQDATNKDSLLYATAQGAIVVMHPLSAEQFAVLSELQSRLQAAISGVGGLSHVDWRAAKDDKYRVTGAMQGFIDGDLVETFLDLPQAKMHEVAADFQVKGEDGAMKQMTVRDLINVLEPLTRIH